MGTMIKPNFSHGNREKTFFCANRRLVSHVVNAEYVTITNVELDQNTAFEGAMKLFKRETNNSNVVNEMRRRRYHEEAWMMRRRKEKERLMKAKMPRNFMTFDDKNPLADNTIFAQEYGTNGMLIDARRHRT